MGCNVSAPNTFSGELWDILIYYIDNLYIWSGPKQLSWNFQEKRPAKTITSQAHHPLRSQVEFFKFHVSSLFQGAVWLQFWSKLDSVASFPHNISSTTSTDRLALSQLGMDIEHMFKPPFITKNICKRSGTVYPIYSYIWYIYWWRSEYPSSSWGLKSLNICWINPNLSNLRWDNLEQTSH